MVRFPSYTTDLNNNPMLASRHAFVTGLTGTGGSAIDPITGDLLFSTFGGSSQVIEVRGFSAPPSTPAPSTPVLLGIGLGGLLLWNLRRSELRH